MTNPEIRAKVSALVAHHVATASKDVVFVWSDLYSRFSYHVNYNFARHAYVRECKQLDVIESEGMLPEFLEFTMKLFVVKTPALPEREKAPVQGSLLEDKGGLL